MPRVGEIFRQERENQGLTLRDIEEVTSIRMRYLEAIEAGDNAALPGEVYAKGFVRNYAIALGLDGAEFVNLYKLELGSEKEPTAVKNVQSGEFLSDNKQSDLQKPVFETFTKEQIKTSSTATKTKLKPKIRLKPLLILLCIFIVTVIIGVYLIINIFYKDPQGTTNTQPASTQTQNTKTETTNIKQVANEASDFILVNDGTGRITLVPMGNAKINEINVEANFKGDCWTKVIADENQIFSGTLRYGSKNTWQAKENMQLRIGNINVVDMSINGKKVDRISDRGPVAEVFITIQR